MCVVFFFFFIGVCYRSVDICGASCMMMWDGNCQLSRCVYVARDMPSYAQRLNCGVRMMLCRVRCALSGMV